MTMRFMLLFTAGTISALQTYDLHCGRKVQLHVDLLERVKQKRTKRRISDRTGLRVWPVARPLLEHLRGDVVPALERDLGRAPRVLELGSGTGLLGIGLALTTDCEVTLTDPEIDTTFSDGSRGTTLDFLRRNIELNGCDARAKRLLWGDVDDLAALRGTKYDLIVGSDLLYDIEGYEPLVSTLLTLDAPALLAYPNRHGAEMTFCDLAEARGLDVTSEPIACEDPSKKGALSPRYDGERK
mmetsp:Transcript_20506/g.61134  ORF Transcript_20506/g.61134 Transcript_20506/m.61134 type:complete len:241 (+) Transcript_20506:108-830(+)